MSLKSFFTSLDKKPILIIGGSGLFLTICIVVILLVMDFREDRSVNAAEEKKMAYDIAQLNITTKMKNRSELIYPEVIEELDLSMDPLRDKRFQWTEEEVSRLWIEAKESDIDFFTEANHQLVWGILKDAP